MNVTQFSIEKKTISYFAIALLTIAGVLSYFSLGKLEDPEFSIKTAIITTQYPGANPEEVELEVTDQIELAIQNMPQLDDIESLSKQGVSIIKVNIKPKFKSADLPQVWDELRKKISDIEYKLPPGARKPNVVDDFGDVYGFLMAVTGDGFSYQELYEYVKELKKELSLVNGVARVELWGEQKEAIYLNTSESKLARLSIPFEHMAKIFTQQNTVVDAGYIDVADKRFLIAPSGEFKSPQDIENLRLIAPKTEDSFTGTERIFRLGDIVEVTRGYLSPPANIMRFNHQPAIALAISNIPGSNIVELGARLDKRLNEIIHTLPVGIQTEKIAWQSDIVKQSIDQFMISLLEALAIVLVVLWLSMGFRMALIIGFGGLIFTIVGTLLFMSMWNIDLQRMSLGALIIAMGMMVDNAIVVAEGIAIRLKKGMSATKAAIEAATQPSWALLGATIVAVLAFFPIYASPEDVGEYCSSLFIVIAISLLLSWVLSISITPLMCLSWLKTENNQNENIDLYSGPMFQWFKQVLHKSIHYRRCFVASLFGLLILSFISFNFIESSFFPASNRPQYMIDYWAAEGTRIEQTSEAIKKIEQKLLTLDGVASVSSFIGQGPPRFYLPVEPELRYASYGQLLVNVKDPKQLTELIQQTEQWLFDNVPEAQTIVRRFGLGPSNTWKVEAKFIGNGEADLATMRKIGEAGLNILRKHELVKAYRIDWREPVMKLVPEYDQERGLWAGITRQQLAEASKRFYDGQLAGIYREKDELLPIIARQVIEQRKDINRLELTYIKPEMSAHSIPYMQVIEKINTIWEDPIIWRYNRKRAIQIQAIPVDGVQAETLRVSLQDAFNAIEKPEGYQLIWDGDFKSTQEAQRSLIPGLLPALVIIALVVVGLFNAFRPPLIILCIIPFAVIGIAFGLLTTQQPFGFMALLGAMSLGGMMIKNAIVLLEQIEIELEAGLSPYDAVVEAAISRLRPVLNAAGTTVLGVIPLLQDIFWVSMAVTIMFGLAFGTLLTLVAVPVLYCIFYRVRADSRH